MGAWNQAAPGWPFATQGRGTLGTSSGRLSVGHFGKISARGAHQDVLWVSGIRRYQIAGKEVDPPPTCRARLRFHP